MSLKFVLWSLYFNDMTGLGALAVGASQSTPTVFLCMCSSTTIKEDRLEGVVIIHTLSAMMTKAQQMKRSFSNAAFLA